MFVKDGIAFGSGTIGKQEALESAMGCRPTRLHKQSVNQEASSIQLCVHMYLPVHINLSSN